MSRSIFEINRSHRSTLCLGWGCPLAYFQSKGKVDRYVVRYFQQSWKCRILAAFSDSFWWVAAMSLASTKPSPGSASTLQTSSSPRSPSKTPIMTTEIWRPLVFYHTRMLYLCPRLQMGLLYVTPVTESEKLRWKQVWSLIQFWSVSFSQSRVSV